MRKAAFVFAWLFLAVCCQGRVITVDDDGPADFNNIQAAIDTAVDGDTVLVAGGTYTGGGNRDIDFFGKAITVRSESGPQSCIIDCQNLSRAFFFHNGEDSNSVLDGVTVTDGYDTDGGGILCLDSSPVIANCIITGNHAGALSGAGGGIRCSGGNPLITNCVISGNSANTVGGAIFCIYSSPTITNCTVTSNSASAGGAIHCYESNAAVTNCILWDNIAEIGSQVGLTSTYSDRPCTLSLNYSDLHGGQGDVFIGNWSTLNWGPGNIDGDPCFVEWGYWDHNGTPDYIWDDFWVHGDYHLLAGSPCIDAGDPNYVPEPNETDLDGNPRIIGGRIDMGAYEYVPPIEAEVEIKPQAVNLASKGKWINCKIWLPEGYNVADIDVNSILLEDEIQADRVWLTDEFAVAKFSRKAVQEVLIEVETPGEVELVVSGELADGTVFEGADVIRVIGRGGKKQAGARVRVKRGR